MLWESQSFASMGGEKKFRLQLDAGYSSQQFDGVSGANFSRLSQYTYGVGFFYRHKMWESGLRYSVVPNVNISPFTFLNGVIGSYHINFSRYDFLTGIFSWPYHFLIVYGIEQAAWTGSPDLGQSLKSDSHYGILVSYDISEGAGSKFKFPISIEYLFNPQRTYTFANYPNDGVTTTAGSEYILKAGAALEF